MLAEKPTKELVEIYNGKVKEEDRITQWKQSKLKLIEKIESLPVEDEPGITTPTVEMGDLFVGHFVERYNENWRRMVVRKIASHHNCIALYIDAYLDGKRTEAVQNGVTHFIAGTEDDVRCAIQEARNTIMNIVAEANIAGRKKERVERGKTIRRVRDEMAKALVVDVIDDVSFGAQLKEIGCEFRISAKGYRIKVHGDIEKVSVEL